MDDPVETWTVAVEADTSELQRELTSASQYGRQFGNALTSAFSGVAIQGRALGDVVRSLASSLSRMALNAAFKPVEQGIGSLFSGLLSASSRSAMALRFGRLPGRSRREVLSPRRDVPGWNYAHGVAGERGAEAIPPLEQAATVGSASRLRRCGVSIHVQCERRPTWTTFEKSRGRIRGDAGTAVARGREVGETWHSAESVSRLRSRSAQGRTGGARMSSRWDPVSRSATRAGPQPARLGCRLWHQVARRLAHPDRVFRGAAWPAAWVPLEGSRRLQIVCDATADSNGDGSAHRQRQRNGSHVPAQENLRIWLRALCT